MKVRTGDRPKYTDAHDTVGEGGGMYIHHRTRVGIYKRNLEQANSNHFVPPSFSLSTSGRTRGEGGEKEEEGDEGLLYAVCRGDGSVEGCISGRKRQGWEEKEGEL